MGDDGVMGLKCNRFPFHINDKTQPSSPKIIVIRFVKAYYDK